ncbi:MAG TPA: methyltransferase domain-containing protein [Flavisolibacter sp.]|nr:methyltransferase domain-containing protein [Flavisolibacter sp.]
MSSFRQRSYKKELLDGANIPFSDIRRNMQELDTINRLLGGHAITQAGVAALLQNTTPKKQILIVEIGCGGGDNLRAIETWAQKKKLSVSLTGVDMNSECIAFAESVEANKGISFVHSDYRQATFTTKPDIVFSSLFCHHFTDDEMMQQLQWMQQNSALGFFINDLHRHPLAYYSIKALTALFSKSYLVKNDAPLSVQRGFKRADWQRLFSLAGITNYRCNWRWAFRWLITCNTHAN